MRAPGARRTSGTAFIFSARRRSLEGVGHRIESFDASLFFFFSVAFSRSLAFSPRGREIKGASVGRDLGEQQAHADADKPPKGQRVFSPLSLDSRRETEDAKMSFGFLHFSFFNERREEQPTTMRLAAPPRLQDFAPPPRRASATQQRPLSDPNRGIFPTPRAYVPR